MKSTALLLSATVLLASCATAPKPVQVLEVCPKVPPLELDVPERDFQGEMANFLRGLLPMQPGLKPPSSNVWPSTTK